MSFFRKTKHDAIIPKRGTKASAGHDFYALTGGRIEPMQRCHIKTGIGWSGLMHNELYGHLKERSSHASKFGILLLAGVIDADYPDDIVVILLNTGTETFSFEKGDRIAQMMVLPYVAATDEELISDQRVGGFGSTNEGVKPSDKENHFPKESLCVFCEEACKHTDATPISENGIIVKCNLHVNPF